jgi:hypothetical protein
LRERLKKKKNKDINPRVADYSRFILVTHEPAFLKACKEMPDYELKNAEDRLKQAKEGKLKL